MGSKDEMGSLGELLRAERERQGISLEQVEGRTKIRRKFLEALEEGDYDRLPGGVYTRGFIRSYASFLGLGEEEALGAYVAETGSPEPGPAGEGEPGPEMTGLSTERSWLTPDLIVAIVLLAAIIGAGYYLYDRFVVGSGFGASPGSGSPTTAVGEPTIASATPQPTATGQAAPGRTRTAAGEPSIILSLTPTVPRAGVQLRIEVVDRAWLRLRVDGEQAFEGIMEEGFSQVWEARREIYVRCGNAGGVMVTVNGRDRGPLGAPGEVVDWTWVAGGVTPTPTGDAISTTAGDATPAAARDTTATPADAGPTATPSATASASPEPAALPSPPPEEPPAEAQ